MGNAKAAVRLCPFLLLYADSYVGLAFTKLDETVDYIKGNSRVAEADTEIGIR